MENFVLITGASNGIGKEMAYIFAEMGFNLLLIARNFEKLNDIKNKIEKKNNIKVLILSKDLTDIESIKDIYSFCNIEEINVEILINNAGFASFGEFHSIDLDTDLSQINLNIMALTMLTKLFLKDMIEKRNGKILNVSSIAAFQPGPLMSVYYASKAYVESFTQAISNESKQYGITVSSLCPGPVNTGFKERAGMNRSNLFKGKGVMSAEKVAKYAIKCLFKGKKRIIPGFLNKCSVFSTRFVSSSFAAKIAKSIQKEDMKK
ncbi:hypothetical protein C7380_11443 [Oceanotoga teriensis]|uniref:Ketoacyl reductase n=1 Tax=Oceanotoga teriensis TaxID=515440 RepID=A0AA45C5T8_9BACT|nr:SDR family oxidoreductase [Oceanotoga teriensis]PWJ89640.1 hypothetical protein C7380_11443 [Oceanotoga teriensis]